MCYMESVGVRVLRQNASVLLARVASTGASIEITSHGRAVARLVPVLPQRQSSRGDLIAAGVLRPGRGDPLELEPVAAPAGGKSTAELLAQDREDR